MDPNAFLKAVYASMKPGAAIGVIDHVANPNSDTRATVEKYHRIDPNVVKADFKRAGFVFVGSSDLLRNPADTTLSRSTIPRSRARPTASSSCSRSRVDGAAGEAGAGSAPRISALITRWPRWSSASLPAFWQTSWAQRRAAMRWASHRSSARCG